MLTLRSVLLEMIFFILLLDSFSSRSWSLTSTRSRKFLTKSNLLVGDTLIEEVGGFILMLLSLLRGEVFLNESSL